MPGTIKNPGTVERRTGQIKGILGVFGCSSGWWGVKCHKESGCLVIDSKDFEDVATGRQAPWIIDRTGGAIARALNLTLAQVKSRYGTRGIAEIHRDYFVPLCRSMEGDLWTTDQGAAEARILNQAYEEFEAELREGTLRFGDETPQPGGEIPPGTVVEDPPQVYCIIAPCPGGLGSLPGWRPSTGQPSAGATPAQAGFGGATALALGLGALLLLGGK